MNTLPEMTSRVTLVAATRCQCALLCLVLLLCFQAHASAQWLPGTGEKPADTKPESAVNVIEPGLADHLSDAQIKSRLTDIFANLPGLSTIAIEVNGGVIILSGTVDDTEMLENAEQLAHRIAGAVMVINKITRDRSLGARLNIALKSIALRFKELAGNAPLLLLALTVIGVALFIARLAGKAERLFERVSVNWFVRDLLRQGIQLVIVFSGVVIALKLLDATALLGSLVGALGIVGLALGFATRDTVENYIASMLLSLRQPFQKDDYISIEGIEGKVLRLTPRATVLMSLEGNHLRIPNAKVYKATITNYTRNPLRRFDFEVGVDTGIDLSVPRALAVRTLNDLPGVLHRPAAQCLVKALGDSSVVLKVLGWIDQRETDYLKIRSEAQQRVKEAFDEAGVIMPEPIYNVNLRRQQVATTRLETAAVPVAAAAEPDSADTKRDHAVEQQMRDERRDSPVEDLLSKNAPEE